MKKNLKVIAFVTFVAVVSVSTYVSVTANLSKVSFMDILLGQGCADDKNIDKHTVWRLNPNDTQLTDLKQIADSIYLVPLETNDSCLIKKVHSLTYMYNHFYINNNQIDIQVYDGEGNFLYGTAKHLGSGPHDYLSAMSFCVLGKDSFEVCDPISLQVCTFSYPKGLVDKWRFPEEVLPIMQYEYLNQDTCVFIDGINLKFYSRSSQKIIKELKGKHKVQFSKTSWALHKQGKSLYCSDIFPSNELYVLTEDLEKKLVLQLDFGKHNFSLMNLSGDFAPEHYYAYMDEHPEYAYPFQKFISDDRYLAYFQFEGKLCVAFKHGKDGQTFLFRNESYSRHQLMIPHHVDEGKVYYAAEPAYLPFVVDTTLMSREDIDRMNRVSEMDNPIIVVYCLR